MPDPDTASRPAAAPEERAILTDLLALYAAQDFFTLASRLETLSRRGGAVLRRPEVRLLRAATATAFNDPLGSNRHLAALDSSGEPLVDSLQVKAAELRLRNYLQLSEYDAAWRVSQEVLALEVADSATKADVANTARAMAVLRAVAPQRVVSRAASEIVRDELGRIPLMVGDSARAYAMDTGANLSVLMRSEAESLGLDVREAGMKVGTSTGSRVLADVAVASSLRLAGVELSNVVFLVLPDETLTFGEFTIPGIIGFPVMNALGEVAFRAGGVLRVPGEVPDRGMRNLALPSLTPVIQVTVDGRDAVCEFDTGAGRTSLHRPFYASHRAWIESRAQPDTVRFAGAGGERRIPAYILSDIRLALGDTAVTMERLEVYTESVATPGGSETDCRLGLDVIASFGGYLINLRSMTFLPLVEEE